MNNEEKLAAIIPTSRRCLVPGNGGIATIELAETLAGSLGPSGSSGNVANYMGQMAMAMGKLGTLEGFIRQADNLRQQTLQQLHRILTTCQSARALLAINDYFSRLRALSSLWLARPRE
ncbi:transcription factor TGA2.2-like [Rhododendron vialii]|uniref:transcription factor TGA2.2-like n=1 Tax=Rhododendron vialii TaxID=182163 RepID=UPI00265F2C4C|nr:transcription factor TGA2.2-like [Rhododendron vialii]